MSSRSSFFWVLLLLLGMAMVASAQGHKYKRLPPWRFAGNDLQDFLMSKRSQIQPEQNDYVDRSAFEADIPELEDPHAPAKLMILRPTRDMNSRRLQQRLSLPFIYMNLI